MRMRVAVAMRSSPVLALLALWPQLATAVEETCAGWCDAVSASGHCKIGGESREDTKARRSREEGGEIKGNGGGADDKDPDEGALESLGF